MQEKCINLNGFYVIFIATPLTTFHVFEKKCNGTLLQLEEKK